MAFDIESLNRSSFRGIPFYTEETGLTGGKRITDHNFINGGNKAEDNGLKNKTFKIKAYIAGDSYIEQKDELIKAFDILGSGTLIDKFYGTIQVQVDSYSVKESKLRFGMAEFEITFKKEENELIVEDLIVYSVDYTDEILENFANDFDNAIGAVLNNSVALGIADAWDDVLDTIKFLEDTRGELNSIKGKIGAVISSIKTSILSIETLTADIADILTSFDDVLSLELFSADDKKSFSNGIRELLNTSANTAPTNEALIVADRQLKTYTNTIVAGLAQATIRNIADVDFETGDDFGSVKDDLLFIFETLKADVTLDEDSTISQITLKQNLLNKYQEAKSDFILFYTQKYSGLQTLQDINIVATTDVLNLTMSKYNDIERTQEVLINNDLIDPFFINGDLKLLDR